jgi:hypothetical protein
MLGMLGEGGICAPTIGQQWHRAATVRGSARGSGSTWACSGRVSARRGHPDCGDRQRGNDHCGHRTRTTPIRACVGRF